MAPSHVLVPLDGSPLADEALERALDLFDCRLTVLNVVTPVDATMSEGGVLEPGADRRESARDRAARIVEMALAPMAGANGGELLFAPSAHAVARLVSVASATRAQKTTPGTLSRLR